MPKVYDDVPEGWFDIEQPLRIACCGCSLTHVFQIRKVGRKYQMRIERDERATALLRRHNGVSEEVHEVVKKSRRKKDAKPD